MRKISNIIKMPKQASHIYRGSFWNIWNKKTRMGMVRCATLLGMALLLFIGCPDETMNDVTMDDMPTDGMPMDIEIAPVTNVVVTAIEGTGEIELRWDGSTSDIAASVLIRWSPGDGERTLTHAAGAQTEVIGGLESNVEYTFTLIVTDGAGNESDAITSEAVRTATDTTAPILLTAFNAVGVSDTDIMLSGINSDSADATTVRITWSADGSILGSTSIPHGAETTIITELDPEIEYTFTLVVEDDEVPPNVTEPVTAVATTLTVIPGPLADVSATAVAGTTDIELRWVGSIRNDISTVRIVWSHGEQERTLSHAAGVQTEIISGLQAELTYFFDFTITDNDGNTSVATRIFARTADITLPNPVSGLSAATVPNTADVMLSWTGSTSDDANMVYITWTPGDGERTLPHAAGMQTETISGLQSGTEYAFMLVVDDGATPPNLSDPATATITTEADSSNPDAVTMPQIVPLSSGTAVNITWVDSSSTDIASISVSWSTGGTMMGSRMVPMGQEVAVISGLTASTPYTFTITVADFADNMASTADLSVTTATPVVVDTDGDTLVDIDSLERLNNVRYNLDLADGYFKSNSVDDGIQCGVDSNIACTGYELTENLDFASAASYAAGTIDADWRPNGANAASSTNAGWDPIGDCNADDDDNYSSVCGDSDDAPFNTLFAGNGNTISNIYARNASADTPAAIGLFGLTGAQAIIRNLGIAGGDFFGNGQNGDRVGALVGNMHDGIVAASHATGVSVHGRGGSDDRVGGLVGYNRSGSTIVSSYASGTADGGAARDSVGGLVGYNSGSILSSYATVNINESGGTHDRIGGLVGRNNGGAIIATYATGNVSGGNGNNDLVGGFVGYNTNRGDITGFITASYATGNANGGSGVRDRAAAFAGAQVGTVISSYGFGVATNGEIAGLHARLSGVTDTGIDGVRQLTTANTGELWAPPTWDLGTTAQAPILRYIDYDGDHTRFGCPGSNATIIVNCGDALPGQSR